MPGSSFIAFILSNQCGQVLVPVPQAHAIISPKAYSRFSGGMSARSTHKTLSLPGVQAETFAWLQDEALHFYPHMIQKE